MPYEVLTLGSFQYGVLRAAGVTNAPLLVHLGTNFADMLNDPVQSKLPYRLINASPSWVVASLDTPCHGAFTYPNAGPGLSGWRYLFDQNVDFVADFVARAVAVVADLHSRGYWNGKVMAVSGISRGFFMAAHYAASALVNAVGISPVTKLSVLAEFAGYTVEPLPLPMASLKNVGGHISISNTPDSRVGTWTAAAPYMQAVSASQGNPALRQWSLTIAPEVAPTSDGHTQVKDADLIAAKWILERFGL